MFWELRMRIRCKPGNSSKLAAGAAGSYWFLVRKDGRKEEKPCQTKFQQHGFMILGLWKGAAIVGMINSILRQELEQKQEEKQYKEVSGPVKKSFKLWDD